MSNYIPSIKEIQEASQMLPNPDKWDDEDFTVPLRKHERRVHVGFRKVKYANSSEERSYRWVYEGKVLIRNRDIMDKWR